MENKVKYYRELAGFSQEQLGNAVGITRQAVSAIELGINQLTISTALKMAKVFNIKWQDLFNE